MNASILISVHQAQNLPKADWIGSIDAYVIIKVPLANGKTIQQQTKVAENTFNPKWEFSVLISDSIDSSREIIMEIWDEDKVGADEYVCHGSFNIGSKNKVQKELILNCIGSFIPSGPGPCSLTYSHRIVCPTFEKMAESSISKNEKKRSLLFPIPGEENLYVQLMMKKSLKLSILDTSQDRDRIAFFEVVGRDCRNVIKLFNTPKRKHGMPIYREITLSKFDPNALLKDVKLKISSISDVEIVNVEQIGKQHGWVGTLQFETATNTLTGVTIDHNCQIIYFNEPRFTYSVDWNANDFDQKVFVTTAQRGDKYYAELRQSTKPNYEVTIFGEPKEVRGMLFATSSSSKDTSFGCPLNEFNIYSFRRTPPTTITLIDLVPLE